MKRLGLTISSILVIACISALAVVLFGSGNKNGKIQHEVYATDITISTEFRSLTIYVDNYLKFKNDPFKIAPSDYNLGVEVKILNYLDKERDDASFANNCFKATSAGAFYLRFYVKTKYGTTKFDTLKITVKDKSDNTYESILLTKEIATISNNEQIDISQYVMPYNINSEDVKYMSIFGILQGSIFAPNGMGNYDIIIFKESEEYLIYNIFTVCVTTDVNVYIDLYDVKNNKISNGDTVYYKLSDEVLLFSYIVEGMVSQLINVEISNNKIVSLISSDAPIIILKVHAVGETEINLKIANKNINLKVILIIQ